MRKPIIGIPADRRLINSHWFHCVGEKYIDAVVLAAGAVPVLSTRAVIAGALFVRVERRTETPLLPLELPATPALPAAPLLEPLAPPEPALPAAPP